MSHPTVILKRGREKSLLRRHPWVFSGAVQRAEAARPGEIVEVRAHDGRFLGRGYYNPRSQIRVRVLSWDESETVDADFWQRRIRAAWARRASPLVRGTGTAWRAIHAESDNIPGLIVDVYGPYLVVQVLTLGIEVALEHIIPALVDVAQPRGILERSDVDVREQEGLPPRVQVLWGEPPPEQVYIEEGGHRFVVDVWKGHKTGFYLDQRENRALVARWAEGREVLNAFSYTGGFAVYALAAGAKHVVNVDTSATFLAQGANNLTLNGFSRAQWANEEGNVFHVLRQYVTEGRTFDMIILDPPKFATSKANLPRAARGYKDINRLAFHLLREGGILATFSCSGLVDPDLFQKIVFSAAQDAGADGHILAYLSQPPDHPVLLTFPEGRYLKGLIVRKM